MQFKPLLQIYAQEEPLIQEKRIRLLEAIDKTGSITHAAKEVPLSYKAAWDAVDAMNNLSPYPLVERQSGGSRGGGTCLTEYGKRLVAIYKELAAMQQEFIEKLSLSQDLKPEELQTLQHITTKLSARNQLQGRVTEVTAGAINYEVQLQLRGGEVVKATITKNSAYEMNLQSGSKAVAIFKASSVFLCNDEQHRFSARNMFRGKIVKVELGSVNAEVVLELSGGDRICANITKESVYELELKMNTYVHAIVKASEVMIGI